MKMHTDKASESISHITSGIFTHTDVACLFQLQVYSIIISPEKTLQTTDRWQGIFDEVLVLVHYFGNANKYQVGY